MQEPKYKGIQKRKSTGGKSLAEQFGSLMKEVKADTKKPKKEVKKEFVFKKGMKGIVVKR